MTIRKVRRSQTVSPFGPGAIIDLVGESFVAEDVSRWPHSAKAIRMPRLEASLRIHEIKTAPARGLPYYRFPQWLFCPSCRRMERWSTVREKKDPVPRCQSCTKKPIPQLVPMRFVAICARGHLSDVDWRRWAHSAARSGPSGRAGGGTGRCADSRLTFETNAGVGGGLQSTEVRCSACGASRSLEDLPTKEALRRVGQRCSGRQPWQVDAEAVSCDEPLAAVQRGASSVYFPEIVSAIDIPPESNWSVLNSPLVLLKANSNFSLVLDNPGHPARSVLLGVAATETGLPFSEVEAVLASLEAGAEPSGPTSERADLIPGEWMALTEPPAGPDAYDRRNNFVARKKDLAATAVEGRLGAAASELTYLATEVTLVEKLREVRVLEGFRRHKADHLISANLGPHRMLLPGVEVCGEGFFLRFNEDALETWERRPTVVGRAQTLAGRKNTRTEFARLSMPTPRFVLLHTFAHLLLRQTAFEAGYSSSSLRERLYVTESETGPRMAGVLIYTAAGDTEGTLGGLVRLGEPDRLTTLIAGALTAARWCSFDPVCGESTGQGPYGLSMAACHACSLVAETSCVAANRLLDRRLVVDEEFGFFRNMLAAIDGAFDLASP
ncbi:DUF1998 domain-containing protein [Pseudofrankia sp. BMG5.36]|uniref:DUF1998 domain-containing protein n=1 Tax=Pseudofrankia sp. BMG5.36 TaxID=1834512 RepID=UPI0008D9E386|nr:DUF1998 domain-containing protein [Pseudofrankia sp. BMG5.36]OHV66830.1 hypothetical protein BCD48_35690 [Pseudofrankia sp. BMG5.36]